MIINTYETCIQKKAEYYKPEPTKQLIFSHPLERVLADLTELPFELRENNEYIYQLNNLIDHFSKFSSSFYYHIKKGKLF